MNGGVDDENADLGVGVDEVGQGEDRGWRLALQHFITIAGHPSIS